MRIYVGNLSYSTTEDALRAAFEEYGPVETATIVTDRTTGRPRGFAFVEMAEDEDAHKAIGALDGSELDGRTLVVNEARPQERRFGGGGGGDRSRGRGGGGRDRGGRSDW